CRLLLRELRQQRSVEGRGDPVGGHGGDPAPAGAVVLAADRNRGIIIPMKSLRAFVVLLAPAGCALPEAAPAASRLRQLQGVDELKSWFNGYQGHPRPIFLLSPT